MTETRSTNRPFLRTARIATRLAWRALTLRQRVLPDFFVLGPPRSATTMLYTQLLGHPCYVKPFTKELGYQANPTFRTWRSNAFYETLYRDLPMPLRGATNRLVDGLYYLGDGDGYRKLYPTSARMRAVRRRHGAAVSGEFTVFGLYATEGLAQFPYSLVAEHAKFISIVREPIAFARSLYAMETGGGFRRTRSGLSFEDFVRGGGALYADPEVGASVDERLRSWRALFEQRAWFDPARYSTVTAMMAYVVFLRHWAAQLAPERFLVLSFDDLCQRTAETMDTVCDFLGIPRVDLAAAKKVNQGPAVAAPLTTQTRDELRALLRPYNEELFEFLGRDLGWNDAPD